MSYEVAFVRSARRELVRLPGQASTRILARIEDLASDPRPRGSRKPTGSGTLRRIRVGDNRVVYDVSDDHNRVEIMLVRHRSVAYR